MEIKIDKSRKRQKLESRFPLPGVQNSKIKIAFLPVIVDHEFSNRYERVIWFGQYIQEKTYSYHDGTFHSPVPSSRDCRESGLEKLDFNYLKAISSCVTVNKAIYKPLKYITRKSMILQDHLYNKYLMDPLFEEKSKWYSKDIYSCDQLNYLDKIWMLLRFLTLHELTLYVHTFSEEISRENYADLSITKEKKFIQIQDWYKKFKEGQYLQGSYELSSLFIEISSRELDLYSVEPDVSKVPTLEVKQAFVDKMLAYLFKAAGVKVPHVPARKIFYRKLPGSSL